MRTRRILFLIVVACALAGCCVEAQAVKPSAKRGGGAGTFSLQGCWRVDHYVYDVQLHRSWAVLLDCDHPGEPSRMVLIPGSAKVPEPKSIKMEQMGSLPQREPGFSLRGQMRAPAQPEIRTGEDVQVVSRQGSSAAFLLAGTAEETALSGHTIRVRLKVNGAMVRAAVCGPHLVVLATDAKPIWRKP
jgi:hypothetical protein